MFKEKLATQLLALQDFVGCWITHGNTCDEKPLNILSSDTYNVAPGGNCLIHQFHGLIGNRTAAGLEVISFDPETNSFLTHMFTSNGNASQLLKIDNDTWKWIGPLTRCNAKFSSDKSLLVANHEKLDKNGLWVPSMTVTLNKVF